VGSRYHRGLPPQGRRRIPQAVGTYSNNPLVVEQGMTIAEARAFDKFGKGGGLVDGKLVREFPLSIG
jgi:hypothetical protein